MEVPFNAIKEVINNFNNGVKQWFSDLGNNIGNFFNGLFSNISNFFAGIPQFFQNFWSDIKSFFINLFVPENNPFEQISVKLNEKFAFVSQIKAITDSFLGFNNYGESIPDFSITYEGTKLNIIDFSMFIDYRPFIHSIILSICWVMFIFRLFKRLPGVIGGFEN